MSNKLQAIVHNPMMGSAQKVGVLGPNGLETKGDLPVAFRVEIVTTGDGIYLIRYDKDGEFCGDTWHQSINEAKEQACFEFNISANDWSPATSV